MGPELTAERTRRMRRPTQTSAFGAGARESHDAGPFYARFQPKTISTDDRLGPLVDPDPPLVCGDSRHLDLPDASVALLVTSPPYFAGKAYEQALGEGVIPATYADYLQMLSEVFREGLRVLEPGGRMAINVANLGRKPYRSLSSDIIRILDDDLGMLLRGEVIWRKAEGAGGNCAWGSYRSAKNPVLRDVTERVIVASKGRFDRAVPPAERQAAGRPHRATITTDEFLEATLDVWEIRPESAKRVQHPAPYPVELPQRLIELYTFEDDLVLDPFVGSGTTAVAAVRTGRRFVGYDTDENYLAVAEARVAEERTAPRAPVGDGAAARNAAVDLIAGAGFRIVGRDRRVPGAGLTVDVVAEDAAGVPWSFDLTGAHRSTAAGLARADELWRCLGRASVLASRGVSPLVLISSELPARRSPGDQALRAVGPAGLHDVLALGDADGRSRLAAYGAGGHHDRPLPGFWTAADGVVP